MNLRKSFAISLAALVFLTGCADSASTLPALAEVSSSMEQSSPESAADVSEEETEMKLLVQIGDKTFTARWENNAAARARRNGQRIARSSWNCGTMADLKRWAAWARTCLPMTGS